MHFLTKGNFKPRPKGPSTSHQSQGAEEHGWRGVTQKLPLRGPAAALPERYLDFKRLQFHKLKNGCLP